MSASPWIAPAWTKQVQNVSFAEEIQLLTSFAKEAKKQGCRVVPKKELDFNTESFADLVIERSSDHQRLMFGLSQKGQKDPSTVDILTRPRTGHARLIKREDGWRLLLGSNFIHPVPVVDLGLAGLLRALLDERV